MTTGNVRTSAPVALPSFPTLFGEKEQQRLTQLEKQKTQMEQIYQQKFTQEAWSRVNPLEKFVRNVPVVRGIVERVLPAKMGWDYGYTPELARQELEDVTTEYRELVRAQKVTTLLPDIENNMIMAALSGNPLQSLSQILPSGLSDDFTDSEKEYLANLGRRLSTATREEILSGKVYQSDKLSDEALSYSDIYAAKPEMSPSNILSTIAFSKDLGEIGKRLTEAFPPITKQTAEDVAVTEAKYKQAIRDRADELGLDITENMTDSQIAKAVSDRLAQMNEGKVIVLSNNETGEYVAATIKADNSIWYGETPLGFYDKETGGIKASPDEEGKWKDVWDAFRFGTAEASQNWMMYFVHTLPNTIWQPTPSMSDEEYQMRKDDILNAKEYYMTKLGWTSDYADKRIQEDLYQLDLARLNSKFGAATNQYYRDYFNKIYTGAQEAHNKWLMDNPDLQPRAEWEDGSSHFDDPMWYFYVIAKNAPVTGAAMLTGAAATAATGGNFLAGAAASGAIMFPLQAEETYQMLIEAGAPSEQAAIWAQGVGAVVTALESAGEIPVLKAASPALMKIFRQQLTKELAGLTVKQAALQAGKVFTQSEIAEISTEVMQQAVQNTVVKLYDKDYSIGEGMWQVVTETAISSAPFALFGGGVSFTQIRNNVKPDTQVKLDAVVQEAVAKGAPQERAEQLAVAELVSTEQGQDELQVAKDKALEAPVISSEEKAMRLRNLDAQIARRNEDLAAFEKSLELQQSRLEKAQASSFFEANEVKATIKSMQENIKETKLEIAQRIKQRDEVQAMQVKKKTTEPLLSQIQKAIDAADERVRIAKEHEAAGTAKPNEVRLAELLRAKLPATAAEGLRQTEQTAPAKATVEEATSTEVATPDIWNDMSVEARLALAIKAGIAKTSSRLAWDDLNDVQQERIQNALGRTTMPKEGIQAQAPTTEPSVAPSEPPTTPTPQEEEVAEETEEGEEAEPTPQPVRMTNIDPDLQSDFEAINPFKRDTLPMMTSFKQEQKHVQEALTKPEIASNVDTPALIKTAKDFIKLTWSNADDKARKRLLVVAGLAKKNAAKNWEDLTTIEQARIVLTQIPDGSIDFNRIRELDDMEYLAQFFESVTGLPFLSCERYVEAGVSLAEKARLDTMQYVHSNPLIAKVVNSPKSLARVAQDINSRRAGSGVQPVTDLTLDEQEYEKIAMLIYKKYEPKVRFMRVFYETSPNIASFKKAFPDAVEAGLEAELEEALRLRKEGKREELWSYLYDKTWGVIDSGYDPAYYTNPSLKTKRRTASVLVGGGRLQIRENMTYDEQGQALDFEQRQSKYIRQMELRWHLYETLETFREMWGEASPKFKPRLQNALTNNLQKWYDRAQGIPEDMTLTDRVVMGVALQSFKAVFLNPLLWLRNSLQAVILHPDKSWLIKGLMVKLPEAEWEQAKLYYDTFVSQLEPIRADYIHKGEKHDVEGGLTYLLGRALDKVNRLSTLLNYYDFTDHVPRLHSFRASFAKASQATEVFKQTGDVKQWLKDSGAIHLEQAERNYVLTHYLGNADKTFSFSRQGLLEVTGLEAANLYIAQRITDITNFKYRRVARGLVEMNALGRTVWSLIVYQRGYGRRLISQSSKMIRAMKGDATWEEARSGFNDLLKLSASAIVAGSMWALLTGRRKNPWDIMNSVLGWQFGGLFYGVASDVSDFASSLLIASNPATEDEVRAANWNKAFLTLNTVADEMLPLHKQIWDCVDSISDKRNLNVQLAKELRALLDSRYEAPKQDVMNRTLWEKIIKGAGGIEPPDPDTFEKTQLNINEAEVQLGTVSPTGKIFTLKDYAGEIESNIKQYNLPDVLINTDEGYSQLTQFYMDCRKAWKAYYELVSEQARLEWRRNHILEEAMLLFWGKYNKTVFGKGSAEGKEVEKLLYIWAGLYGITPAMKPTAEWEDIGADTPLTNP